MNALHDEVDGQQQALPGRASEHGGVVAREHLPRGRLRQPPSVAASETKAPLNAGDGLELATRNGRHAGGR